MQGYKGGVMSKIYELMIYIYVLKFNKYICYYKRLIIDFLCIMSILGPLHIWFLFWTNKIDKSYILKN